VIRAALSDTFFDSIRLVAVNLTWGATLIAIVLVALVRPLAAVALLPVLAVPTAAVMRAAARIVRGSDDRYRTAPLLDRSMAGRALVVGAGAVIAGSVLVANVALGLGRADPIGWALATLAGWGLVALAGGLIVGWPLLVDPARDRRSLADRLAIAGRILLVHPGWSARLAIATALIVAVSVVLTAAILTISVAFVGLVLCRSVYPVADALDPVDLDDLADDDRP
jgi:hypothetical protein